MSYKTILYTVTDNIATITLNRPDVMNSLNSEMRSEIRSAIEHAQNEARVLVFTGAGRGFCSGQDLADQRDLAEVNLEKILRDEYEPMLNAIYNCPIPTISAVNGAAVGAGANLALAADVVIATQSAYFIQAFSRIGLIPDAGGTYWLPRQIGFSKAMGAALFADKITAQQASDWGMIWEYVADEGFDACVQARATHLANGPTKSYELTKRALRCSLDNTLGEQLELEAVLQGEAGQTHDFLEGVAAFMGKRSPKYTGE